MSSHEFFPSLSPFFLPFLPPSLTSFHGLSAREGYNNYRHRLKQASKQTNKKTRLSLAKDQEEGSPYIWNPFDYAHCAPGRHHKRSFPYLCQLDVVTLEIGMQSPVDLWGGTHLPMQALH